MTVVPRKCKRDGNGIFDLEDLSDIDYSKGMRLTDGKKGFLIPM